MTAIATSTQISAFDDDELDEDVGVVVPVPSADTGMTLR